MNRPWVIWSFSALIALLVFGAMGAITQHTLGLEKERAVAEAKAELEGRIRIALWRMDTSASGILAEENNRPSWHFRDVDLGQAMQLSPLNLSVPENIKLHFEVRQGQLTTPQVNGWAPSPETQPAEVWKGRSGQIIQGINLSEHKLGDWNRLNDLLYHDTTFLGWQIQRNVLSPLADNNLGMICAVAHGNRSNWKLADQSSWDAQVAVVEQQRLINGYNDIRNAKGYQSNFNAAEKAKRNQIVTKSTSNQRKLKAQKEQKKALKPTKQKEFTKQEITKEKVPQFKSLSKEELTNDQVDKRKDDSSPPSQGGQEKAENVRDAGDALAQQIEAFVGSETPVEDSHLPALTPVWIGGELILVREVKDSQGKRIQGVWLETKAVRESLLNDIADLLPDAQLEPVKQSLKVLLGEELAPEANDPMVMAALPWRLLPGEMAVVQPGGWTPMRKTLAVAWIGAVLAALAAVILLRGVVKLSERRASFVSSVTHELRTPLTTFSLYSDMLAEGMVKDEARQKDYLHTLRKESARLTHLVENVLAYSRIERGSARARVELVQVGSLVDRMCERLRSRADEAGMELRCDVDPQVAEREIEIDITAVEQIIFNLVDNACKYGVAADEDEHASNVVELHTQQKGKQVVFQVRDEGPGVDPRERKKLFRAFHKSAQEAAHSKPGVGLGLALCRRLARALGGDLKILDCEKGACFELSLGG